MSIRVMSLCWGLPLDHSSLFTLFALADHASDNGEGIYPGNARLARKTSMGLRQSQRNLAHLETHGLIRRAKYPKGGHGRAVEWAINVEFLQTMTSTTWFDMNRDSCDRKGCHLSPGTMTSESPQPSGTIMNREDLSTEEHPRGESESMADYLIRLANLT